LLNHHLHFTLFFFHGSSSEKYSEQSIELAPIWYEYGNSLLAKEEDNPTDSLLGKVFFAKNKI